MQFHIVSLVDPVAIPLHQGKKCFPGVTSQREEDWITFDALGMLQQLGVIPAPGQVSQSLPLASGS